MKNNHKKYSNLFFIINNLCFICISYFFIKQFTIMKKSDLKNQKSTKIVRELLKQKTTQNDGVAFLENYEYPKSNK